MAWLIPCLVKPHKTMKHKLNKISGTVRGGGLNGAPDPERKTCPMKLGMGSTSSLDRHWAKSGSTNINNNVFTINDLSIYIIIL